ncbi:hypothetical protein DVA86_17495 [Streptomyces armeniacus]|uniref:Uncharacterized protein n=1 Tax=Streptomyces armeniacus TaxID=83291 RepID=A0A345XRB3_9ACTN|nr:hypothetical protein DVA86_17495 [Streptomyces armeniacus]
MTVAPRPAAPPEAEGCLAVAVRWPVRVVVLLLVVPVRMAWDALVACGRVLRRVLWQPLVRGLGWLAHTFVAVPAGRLWRWVLAPVGRGVGVALVWLGKALFVWPWVALWRHVLTPLGHGLRAAARGVGAAVVWLVRYGLVVPVVALWTGFVWLLRVLFVWPAQWMYRRLLTPAGHGLSWLWRTLLVLPAVWTYAHVLTPLGHGLRAAARGIGAAVVWLVRYGLVVPVVALWTGFVWLLRALFVWPAQWTYRWLLTPLGRALAVVGREIRDAFVMAWSAAGRISRAVFGFLGRLLKWIFVAPVVQVWRHVVRPAGRGLRDHVWRPAAGAVREAGRAVRGALAAARASARQTRAELRRALFGAPRKEPRDPLSR